MKEHLTFDIVVEQSFAGTNTFTYDEHAHAIRLDGIVRVNDPTWANRGYVYSSSTLRGEPLRAFLISDLPIPPSVRVEARAVGALEWAHSAITDRTIVAVPVADTRYSSAYSLNDLPSPHRAVLQRLIEPPASARWLDANTAGELVDLARQRARLAQVAQREQGRSKPKWESDSSRSLIDRLARETYLHTQAEAALFLLPYRFQRYLRLCRDSDERILFWVHRPPFITNRVLGIGAFGRLLREGLLLLTDRQILWMIDSVTPTIAVEGYGYVARSVAPEMLCRATVEVEPEHLALRLTSENALRERADFEIEFPLAAREALEQAARFMNSFLPCKDDCRLRRVASPRVMPIELVDATESDREKTRVLVDELEKLLEVELRDEMIYAHAPVPAWGEGGPKLITVTNHYLYISARSRHANHSAQCLSHVVTPEICFSVLGSWLKLNLPQEKSVQITFPPTAFKSFNDCWVTPRRLSSNMAAPADARELVRKAQC